MIHLDLFNSWVFMHVSFPIHLFLHGLSKIHIMK